MDEALEIMKKSLETELIRISVMGDRYNKEQKQKDKGKIEGMHLCIALVWDAMDRKNEAESVSYNK